VTGGLPVLRPVAALPSAEGYLQRVRQCFEAAYAAGADVWTTETSMRHAARLLDEELGQPGRVLDVGAGRGVDSAFLAGRGHHVTALDVLPVADPLDVDLADRIEVVVGALDVLPVGATYDGILDNGCLHHQHPDRLGAHVAALTDRLGPGGVLVVSTFACSAGDREHRVTATGRLNLALEDAELTDLLAGGGLDVTAQRRVARGESGRSYLLTVARSERRTPL
jgi:SAM-dependent methyltransferase